MGDPIDYTEKTSKFWGNSGNFIDDRPFKMLQKMFVSLRLFNRGYAEADPEKVVLGRGAEGTQCLYCEGSLLAG